MRYLLYVFNAFTNIWNFDLPCGHVMSPPPKKKYLGRIGSTVMTFIQSDKLNLYIY